MVEQVLIGKVVNSFGACSKQGPVLAGRAYSSFSPFRPVNGSRRLPRASFARDDEFKKQQGIVQLTTFDRRHFPLGAGGLAFTGSASAQAPDAAEDVQVRVENNRPRSSAPRRTMSSSTPSAEVRRFTSRPCTRPTSAPSSRTTGRPTSAMRHVERSRRSNSRTAADDLRDRGMAARRPHLSELLAAQPRAGPRRRPRRDRLSSAPALDAAPGARRGGAGALSGRRLLAGAAAAAAEPALERLRLVVSGRAGRDRRAAVRRYQGYRLRSGDRAPSSSNPGAAAKRRLSTRLDQDRIDARRLLQSGDAERIALRGAAVDVHHGDDERRGQCRLAQQAREELGRRARRSAFLATARRKCGSAVICRRANNLSAPDMVFKQFEGAPPAAARR